MTTSRFPEITDELLSAYIDNAVTPGERALIEQAASEDGVVAWRLATLRETVALLRALPVLNAPRSFVLTPEMVAQSRAESVATTGVVSQNTRTVEHPPQQPASQPGWWVRLVAGWRAFWAGGSPVWRNALATSMAALLALLMLPGLLRNSVSTDSTASPMVSQVSQDSAAVSASESVMETAADAHVENATNTAGKLVNAATVIPENDNSQGAEVVVLATAARATEAEAPLALSIGSEAVAAPTEAEIVAASAAVNARTIPGGRTTEDALGAVASAEGAPASLLADSAPPAPELAAPVAGDAAPGDVMLAAPLAEAAAAAPASPQTLAMPDTSAAAANPDGAAPTAIVMSTATVAGATTVAAPTIETPTAVTVAEADPKARNVATAPVAVTAMPTNPPAPTSELAHFLPWLQLAALMGVVVFGFLWWRSRRN